MLLHSLFGEQRLVSYDKEAVVAHYQMQSLASSLMKSLHSKEHVKLFWMHNMEELDDLNYDYINVKVMWYNCFYQHESEMSNPSEFHEYCNTLYCLHQVESIDDIVSYKMNLEKICENLFCFFCCFLWLFMNEYINLWYWSGK